MVKAMTQAIKNYRKVLIGNLPQTSVEELTEAFCEFSNSISEISLFIDQKGKSAGHAYIEMTSREHAESLVDQNNTIELKGRLLNLSLAEQTQDCVKQKKRWIFF